MSLVKDTRNLIANTKRVEKKEETYKMLLELIEDYNKGIENETLDKYIKELSDIMFCDTNPIPIKYTLSKKGYSSMYLRLPLVELSKDKRNNIDIILN